MLVAKIRSLDRIREKRARDLAILINYKNDPIRLLEIAYPLFQGLRPPGSSGKPSLPANSAKK